MSHERAEQHFSLEANLAKELIMETAEGLVFDGDDCLFERNPNELSFKTASVAILIGLEKKGAINNFEFWGNEYKTRAQLVLKDSDSKLFHRQAFLPHIQAAFDIQSELFWETIDQWVSGTLTRNTRPNALATLHISQKEFDAANSNFSKQYNLLPQQYLQYMSGAEEFLNFVYKRRDAGDFRFGVHLVTNSTPRRLRDGILNFLNNTGMNRFNSITSASGGVFIEDYTSFDETHPGYKKINVAEKPSPKAVQHLLGYYNVPQNGILRYPLISFGNDEYDVQMANKAGMYVVLVNNDMKSSIEGIPDMRVDTLETFMRYLNR